MPTIREFIRQTTRTVMPQRRASDQRRAIGRDERIANQRQIGMACLARQRATWWLNNNNLAMLAKDMILSSGGTLVAAARVHEMLHQPWKYRADFVIAMCRRLDA